MGIFDRFKKKKEPRQAGPLYCYTEEEMKRVEEFIEENFGEFKEVFHEIFSPDIHVDILILPPTKEANYYKLITMGMGAYKMNVPPELKQYELERAEIVIFLPPDWDIKSSDEKDYWPIRQLKVLARLPIQRDTWLGWGHTVSSDRENTPYADNTKLCSMMLIGARDKNGNEPVLRLKDKGRINFYQAIPIYAEELDYKQEHDAESLLDLMAAAGITKTVDIDRPNCRENLK